MILPIPPTSAADDAFSSPLCPCKHSKGGSNDECAFFVALGGRIATLRKAQGLTQVQLAEAMGVAQQTLAHYEAGRLRLLAGALPNLANQLGVTVEELVGTTSTAKRIAGKRGPQPKIAQQLQQIEALPKAKQRMVTQMIDAVLAQATR